MKWIHTGDLKNWVNGNQRHCAQTLPELIRRLIFATTTIVEEINFPSGDSIATAGWDGYLKTPDATILFPSGSSAWEIGTETTPGKKAESDYIKRTGDSLGFVKSETSFVFVTPRSWPDRTKWQNSKKATKKWKDVRVIAADGLEQWLELAPAVALWLGRQIKGLSDSVRDLEGFWEEWSAVTDPKMTTDIVLGGRIQEVERIKKWLKDEVSIIEIRGDSPDEPFAFLYSVVITLSENEKIQALSRCVVVESAQQLRSCATTFKNSLIIVAPSECRETAGFAVKKGHHVFLSADSKSINLHKNIIRLSRPRREIVEDCLHQTGLSRMNAKRLARDFGRSIPVLRRHLSQSSARTPVWADEKSAAILIPLLFAGAWDENKEGDKQLIESLTGLSYIEYIKLLNPFIAIDDSPIRKVGSVFILKSPLDAWYIIAPHITDENLKLFEQAIISALTKTDPKYDLDANKRWMASVYGKSSPYSEWIREGLVESLIFVAVHGDRSVHLKTSTQFFADTVVKNIFATANKWEMWASIKDVTPLLAEASPDMFMKAIENIIAENQPLLKELMSDDGTLFSECQHSGLLWALESISWSSDYFSRAVSILLELSSIDIGGKWNNRPINSLRDIFMPSLPQTHVAPEQRLAALEMLISKDPKTVWQFTKNYYSGGSMSESHMFKWRDTGGSRRGLEPESVVAHSAYLTGLLPMLCDLACQKENIISSTDEFTRLPEDIKEKLLATLVKEDVSFFSKEEQIEIFHNIREVLNWINNYGDDEHRKKIPVLLGIYEKFTPDNILERYGWLLSDPWPRLPQGEPKGRDIKNETIKTSQEEAAREVLDKASVDEIINFAISVQYIGVLGHVIGKVVQNGDEDDEILDRMIERIKECSQLVKGYALGRVEKNGHLWIDQQIARLVTKGNYSAEACSLLYFGIEECAETWNLVSSYGNDVETAYWKQANGYSQGNKEDDASVAVEKLLNVKRPEMALRIAGDSHASISSLLLQRLLQDLLDIDDTTLRNAVMDEFYLGNVFNQIYQRNELPLEEIARIEWPYAALFDGFKRHATSSTALHRMLQNDPLFFSQLISFLYKSENKHLDQEKLDNKSKKNRADGAYKVLDSWYLLPGVKDDGSVNEEELKKWIFEARTKCLETGHIVGCDIQIGFILAHAPSDQDGTWPHVAVRNVIEYLNNETIDDHIKNEIYNSRGVVSRGINDGGSQERNLVEKYKQLSDNVKTKWPRTSALLLSMSKSYEFDAKREDVDSDLHDLSWR